MKILRLCKNAHTPRDAVKCLHSLYDKLLIESDPCNLIIRQVLWFDNEEDEPAFLPLRVSSINEKLNSCIDESIVPNFMRVPEEIHLNVSECEEIRTNLCDRDASMWKDLFRESIENTAPQNANPDCVHRVPATYRRKIKFVPSNIEEMHTIFVDNEEAEPNILSLQLISTDEEAIFSAEMLDCNKIHREVHLNVDEHKPVSKEAYNLSEPVTNDPMFDLGISQVAIVSANNNVVRENSRISERENFEETNFEIIPTIGEGHCLFHAVVSSLSAQYDMQLLSTEIIENV